MSSSSLNNDNRLHSQLTDLHSHVVKYQCLLIESFVLNDSSHSKDSIFVIADALRHEKAKAGNLAGKLDVELIANVWSIGKSDFLEKATAEDKIIITQKLNSVPGKRSFSEDDIRVILQNLLISKFDTLLNVSEKQDVTPVLLKQHQFLSSIRLQLDACLHYIEKNDEVHLKQQLGELDKLIKNSAKLFPESKNIPFFSEQTLPHELKLIIHEASVILESQKQLLSIHYRAS